MGLLSGILGMASEVDSNQMESELQEILIEGESIRHGFKLIRDLVVFTDIRLILIDKQGWTGKKKEYLCIPFRSIDFFSKETTGTFDLDAEIKLWIKSRQEPISLEFRKDTHIHQVFRVLSESVLS
jgi:hypothetical protein